MGVLTFHTTDYDGVALVEMGGSLDEESYKVFRKKMRRFMDEGPTNLLFDLSTLDFVDGEGVGALEGAIRAIREFGGDLRLVGGIGPNVKDALEASEPVKHLRRFADADEGLRSYR